MKISSKEALRNLSKHFSGADRVGPAGGHAWYVVHLPLLSSRADRPAAWCSWTSWTN